MFPLPNDGWLIDTPGVKGFGTFDMEREEVGHYFREIFRFSAECRYNNCTHTHEPGCAVLDALDKQFIAPSRYNSYLSMLDDRICQLIAYCRQKGYTTSDERRRCTRMHTAYRARGGNHGEENEYELFKRLPTQEEYRKESAHED